MAGGNPEQPVVTDPPTTRSIDAKTMARKFNEGQQKNPSYEFGGGRRRFYQERDQENEQ